LAGLTNTEPHFGWTTGSLAVFAGMFLLGGKSSRKRLGWLAVLTVLGITMLMLGCGGGGSSSGGGGGSKSLTGTVTVNATNGTVTRATTVTVTVN
jgi:hypothetical protein